MFENIRKRLDSESFVSLVLGIAVVLLLGSLVFNYFSGRKATTGGQAAQTTKEGQTPIEAPTTYNVAEGDTLWSIAQKYYQSGYNWVDLVKANKIADSNHIEAGEALTIPVVTPIVPPAETSAGQISAASVTTEPSPATYTVVHGDTLWAISLTHYGTGYRWPDIAKANHLANPDLIHAGNVFVLP